MSVIKEVDTLNPYAKSDKVLNINLDSQSDAYIMSNLIYEAGTYVFAIWVKTDANSTVNFKILGTDVSFEATDSWQLFTKRIDADSSDKSVEIKPQININSYFYEGFLSKGTTFTGWSPAPEDVDEDINNAQSSADKANTNASNAQQSANSAQQTASNASNKADSAQSSADKANTSASNAQNSANNAQNTANDASSKANHAQSSADSATAVAQAAKEQAEIAQKASNDANELAHSAWTGVSELAQVVKIDQGGVKVLEAANSKNYAKMQSNGLHVFTNENQVAQFGEESKMRNLAVQDYLMFGAHRAEMRIEDGEEGTALFHVGDIK